MKKTILIIISLLSLLQLNATHIVGGGLFYEHLGGSSYKVTIRLYKDCSPSSINFSSTLRVQIRKGDGTNPALSLVDIPLLARDTLSPDIDTCAFDPGVCVELGVYSKIINLPPQIGGYHLFYSDCCRNSSVVNVVNPLNAGDAFHTYIPDNNIYLSNSSPIFTTYPPVFICSGVDVNYDFSATDIDGDSLVYSLFTPYDGRNQYSGAYTTFFPTIDPLQTAPDNITFTNTVYSVGFSASNPLNAISGNPLTISQNGLLTGVPDMVGQFLVGVMVEEYRNGVKIGSVLRDFQFNVLDCPPLKDAVIGEIDACSGLSISMVNNSGLGANGFWWDFGTGNPADTSILETPVFAYPSEGTYEITLLAQKGTLCADTTYQTIVISNVVADFSGPDTLCLNEAGLFTNLSIASNASTITSVQWDFGDNSTGSGNSISHEFSSSGDFSIELIVESSYGCSDTLLKNVHVKSPPVPNFDPLQICTGTTITFNNLSSTNASDFWWYFGTGNNVDTSIISSPTFTFPTYGPYPVTLVSQRGTACADTIIQVVNINNVVAEFLMPDSVCENSIIDFENQTTTVGTSIDQWLWDFGNSSSSGQFSPTYSYSTSGNYQVKLIANSNNGCTDTIIHNIVVVNQPLVDFVSSNLCTGLSVNFGNVSENSVDNFYWNFGTGIAADTSIIENPSFSFPTFGTYNVTLTTNHNDICETEISHTVLISDIEADFNIQDTACINSLVSITDQSSSTSSLQQWSYDFGDLSTSLSPNNFHEYNSAGTFTIQQIVIASDGCSDTIQKQIVIVPAPEIDLGIDTAQCISSPQIDLSASIQNTGGINWSDNGGNILPNNTNLNITYDPSNIELLAGGTFLTGITTGNLYCSAVQDSIYIDFIEIPSVNISDSVWVCADQNFIPIDGQVLLADGTAWTTNGSGIFTNELIINTAYSPSFTDLNTGSVTLVLSTFNDYGCEDDADTLILSFNALPIIDIDYKDTVCKGSIVDLTSNSTTGNGWWETFGDGYFVNSDTGANVEYQLGTIDNDLEFVILAFHTLDNSGCDPLNDTILITILPAPIAEVSMTNLCVDDTVYFEDVSVYFDDIVGWNWYIEDSIYNTNTASHVFDTKGNKFIDFVIITDLDCRDSVRIPIKVNDHPVANFESFEPCDYGAVFTDFSTSTESDPIEHWNWEFGLNDFDTVPNPVHQYENTGTFIIHLEVETELGCTHDTSKVLYIYPPPNALFNIASTPATVNELINFYSKSYSVNAPIIEWYWNFDNGLNSEEVNPSTSYESGGVFDVELVVFDDVGCRDTLIQEVVIMHGPLLPTAFTPNSDGENDYLMILGEGFTEIDFSIYNNWGEVIFNTKDINSLGWDGMYQGLEQPMGIYVYKAKVIKASGEEVFFSGDVTLIR